jgi:hypothetical protein
VARYRESSAWDALAPATRRQRETFSPMAGLGNGAAVKVSPIKRSNAPPGLPRRLKPSRGKCVTASALPGVLLLRHMEKEKPTVISPRVYKRHRVIIKKAARRLGVSEAEIVRMALDAFEEGRAK